jgi:hypothetical protein
VDEEEEDPSMVTHIGAATYRLLVLIRDFDEREGWNCGFRSCAAWLSWRTGIAPGPAREKVRVAKALASLPGISEAMARGELSYSRVRALTRVATPENEVELLEVARHSTAVQTERLVRGWRRLDRLEEAEVEKERHLNRYVRLHPDEDGSWVLRGRLDPEVGALLQKALEWACESLYREEASSGPANGTDADPDIDAGTGSDTQPDPEDEAVTTTAGQRQADALGLLAERALAEAGVGEDSSPESEESTRTRPLGRAERFQVVLHVDAGALEADSESGPGAPDGGGVLAESGIGVPAGTSRRMACDAGVVEMRHGSRGEVLDVGRRRRTVPPAIRRALEHRDGGCRFPGCECRYTDAHHITHWADGGETKLQNLVLLCSRHHRAVHEEGFRVELGADGGEGSREACQERSGRIPGTAGAKGGAGGVLTARFYWPDGRLLPEVPDPPILPSDPLAALTRSHRQEGIEPGPWTPTPAWYGETLDLGLTLDMLRHPLARERQAQIRDGSG